MPQNRKVSQGYLPVSNIMSDEPHFHGNIATWYHFVAANLLLLPTISAIFMNGCVIYIFCCKDRKLLNRSNTYVCVFCIISLFTTITAVPMVIISNFAQHWVFGYSGCIYHGFVVTLCGLSQIFILTMFVVDRYILIQFCVLDENKMKHFTLLSITGSCSAALILAVCPLMGWNRYAFQGVKTSCAVDMTNEEFSGKSYQITLLVLCFALPVITMMFCFAKIFSKFKQVTTLQSQQENALETKHRYMTEKDLAITIIWIIVLFLITWTPYTIVLVLSTFTSNFPLHPIAASICMAISKTGGCFTPLVYLRRNQQIRKAVLELFPWCRKITIQQEVHNEQE